MLIRGYNSLEAKSAGTQCDLPSYPDPTPSREEKGRVKQVQLCWWAFVIIIVA